MSWKFCPHCGEKLDQVKPEHEKSTGQEVKESHTANSKKYDQTAFWKEIMKQLPAEIPTPVSLVTEALSKAGPHLKRQGVVKSTVHLVFSDRIVPNGGSLLTTVMSNGRISQRTEQLKMTGYTVNDGNVVLVDDVPVGPAYEALTYWGGERQHRRWHLAEAITINPSRMGDPNFMDENMIAFGADWADLEKLEEALAALLGVFAVGVRNDGAISDPLVLRIFWQ